MSCAVLWIRIRMFFGPDPLVRGKAVNREDKLSRRYRGRDLAKFERSRRYRER
jgi:hypothetical protein